MLKVVLLGSGASTPTPSRNQPCILVDYEGNLVMLDCGEGAQKQMMLARTGMDLKAIFITHYHADHILGIPGILQTLQMRDRTQKLSIYGPPGIQKQLGPLLRVGYFKPGYPLELVELSPKHRIQITQNCQLRCFETQHGVPSLGYVLEENPRPGKFDREKALQLGLSPGPVFKRIQLGYPALSSGRLIIPEQILGPPRPGRKLVYTGDTRPCQEILENSRDADLLIHDGTFSHQHLSNAMEAGHSTLLEAAQIAHQAKVKYLITVHLSPRYETELELIRELRSNFPAAEIGRDFMAIEIPYPEKGRELNIHQLGRRH